MKCSPGHLAALVYWGITAAIGLPEARDPLPWAEEPGQVNDPLGEGLAFFRFYLHPKTA
ncbi:MAG: hypothetical protein CM1200mP29_00240 [Verrucomicrobiota bacterium]|nr:MAG: hypothetical protein CM1200mP29_00240 [Verrucomicrobiota bacterium]